MEEAYSLGAVSVLSPDPLPVGDSFLLLVAGSLIPFFLHRRRGGGSTPAFDYGFDFRYLLWIVYSATVLYHMTLEHHF